MSKPGKQQERYSLYGRLGGPQGRSGREENLVPTGIRSRTVQPVVSRYTDWATRWCRLDTKEISYDMSLKYDFETQILNVSTFIMYQFCVLHYILCTVGNCDKINYLKCSCLIMRPCCFKARCPFHCVLAVRNWTQMFLNILTFFITQRPNTVTVSGCAFPCPTAYRVTWHVWHSLTITVGCYLQQGVRFQDRACIVTYVFQGMFYHIFIR